MPNVDTKTYGIQMTTPGPRISDILVGHLPPNHPLRGLQINRIVTSGVYPSGTTSRYGAKHTWAQREPIFQAIRKASVPAVQIKAFQPFGDGNHRTAIFTFVLALASHHVLLHPTFSIHKAYVIISACDHPSNHENNLSDDGVEETASKLAQYSRRRNGGLGVPGEVV
ncbi:MAG: hypothetical protein TREMPRED_004204 [Tremellales sp. Tagirdzhanova-0007]|nr:MAG: hypothetical protein TREMPRED_004204 [Tremellales sp. Tagirdzhanova-0007]